MNDIMKRLFFFVFCLAGLISSGQISLVPASPYPLIIKQPDGTKFSVYAKGDEYLHYSVTEDGYTVIKNNRGVYEYAEIGSNGELLPSGIKAKNIKDRGFNDMDYLSGSRKNLKPDKKMPAEILKSATAAQTFPSQGTKKTLLLLIKYPDLNSNYTVSNFNNLMNQVNYGGTGSMHDYYLDCSDNKLDLSVDVFGWYVASHNYLYYADKKNDDNVARELVREAVDAAEAAGVDFSLYDNDGDGTVENIMIVHSGPGALCLVA
jgi:hypothetical protein